ncbi:hypothetical protein [Bacillus haikouensis]|uniref:hypothetical protein n=1 Tax=Bacillus haikouensis TaxID=1510468 RepID=UPI0035E45DB2
MDNHYYYSFLKWINTIARFKLNKLNCQESVETLKAITDTNELILRHDLLALRILHSVATIYAEFVPANKLTALLLL